MTQSLTVEDEDAADERWIDRVRPTATGQWLALLMATAVLSGALAFAVARRPSHPVRDSVEVRFLLDMIGHHEQALQLSVAELHNGADPNVMVFAQEILRQQSFEIGLMTQKLAEWGYSPTATTPAHEMPGMAEPEELDALAEARGTPADGLFVRLMQDHHTGGAQMADSAARNSSDAFVKDLAVRMAKIQRQEIREMESARQRANLPTDPPGWSPAFPRDGKASGPHEGHD